MRTNCCNPVWLFELTRKLLRLNEGGGEHVEVVLLSRNSADTGLRVFNAITHYRLGITRAVFTGGTDTSRYVPALGSTCFCRLIRRMSGMRSNQGTQRQPSCRRWANAPPTVPPDELRIAFDGDAVLFSDEAERVYQAAGLDAFSQSEQQAAGTPLGGGPFKNFLAALHRIQTGFPRDRQPIRTALVTARSAPAHERVIRTLRDWGIRIDEALFLGGLDKAEFLRLRRRHLFDDQRRHVESASRVVTAGHVPHGITNRQ